MSNLPAGEQLRSKAQELSMPLEMIACAMNFISQNRNLVNAIDHRAEMDDYIYKAIIRQYTEERKQKEELALQSNDPSIRAQAEKSLSVLSREELTTDPYYRAVLPLLVKVVTTEPILRLHADEASSVVMTLADVKRRHRATSVTEIIVSKCSKELENMALPESAS
jgi:hypothetical protein